MISRKVARELHMRPRARNNFGNRRVYRRVRFWSCGTLGYGPTMWVKKIGRWWKVTLELNLRKYREQSKEVSWKVPSGYAIARCLSQGMKGVQSNGDKYCLRYQNWWSLGRWSWIIYEVTREEQPWEPVVYRRVRIRSCGTMGMGPPCGLKVGGMVTSCTVMVARHGRG